jgi:hypothetical protein
MNPSEEAELFALRQLKASLDAKAKVMRDNLAAKNQPKEAVIWEAIQKAVKAKNIDVLRFAAANHDGAHKAAEEIEEDVRIFLRGTGFTCEISAIKRRLRKMALQRPLEGCITLSKTAASLLVRAV